MSIVDFGYVLTSTKVYFYWFYLVSDLTRLIMIFIVQGMIFLLILLKDIQILCLYLRIDK